MAFAIVAVVAVGCFILMDAEDSYAETSGSCGENLTWSIDGEGNLTIIGTGEMTGYGYDAVRWGGNTVKTVSFPNGLTTIGMQAFRDCTSLTSVAIPDSVTRIEGGAFYGCTSLTSVTIPDSVTSIEGHAFRECTSLASVTIPDSVTSIEFFAFYGCTSLASVTIPDSVTVIEPYTFYGCTSLASVTIPDSVTSIKSDAFYNCTSLTEVNVTCTNLLGITKGAGGNGYVAYYATAVNLLHPYTATYGWADDGSSCTVHIVCANDAAHNHDIIADVASSVKIAPTCSAMGTTAYSVSGTYDGFAYSDTKDVVDIPPQHAYTATYGWADDGSSCTVHIVCANDAAHNHDIVAEVASSVKIQPTATTKGTTEYSVSGTYDGFAYSDTKDVQDIPVTDGSSSEIPITYVAIGGVAVLALAGAAFFLIRRR